MVKLNEKLFVKVVCSLVLVAIVISIGMVCMLRPEMQAYLTQSQPKPIYQGNTSLKQVSIMVNVYWGEEYLDSMLKTLKEAGVSATFFFGGMWVEKNAEMLKRIYLEGHEIANHGYFHKDGDKINFDRNYEEIVSCERMIFSAIGVKTTLFAPPSGAFSKATLESANSLGYKVIMWSKDTIDWRDKDVELLIRRATKNIANGDLVLMHPTECTAQALPEILRIYKEQGFKVVKVSTNIEAF